MPQEDPIQLIKNIVAKDVKSFELFYDAFSGLAMTMAMRILKDSAKAEEVVQDVFFEIWNKAAQYQSKRGAPEAWVIVLTRCRAIDKLRGSRLRDQNTVALEENQELIGKISQETSFLAGMDVRLHISGLLSQLSDEQRIALELAYYDGMTQTEIAEKLSIPHGTVKTRIRDGLLRLKSMLYQQEGGYK